MLSRSRITPFDITLYVTVVLAWGFAWIAIHFQIGAVPPDVSIVWRFLLAGIVTVAIAAAWGERLGYGLREHAMFGALGVTLFSVNFLFYYHAAETLPSGLLSIIFSLVLFINVGFGAMFLKAPIDRRVLAGGVLGVFGMTAMFYPQFAAHDFPVGALIALGLALIGTVFFCAGSIVSALLSRREVSVFAANGYAMLYGTAATAAYTLARGNSFTIEWRFTYIAGLIYLALIASVVAFWSYLTLVKRIGADRAGYVTVLSPILALAVSTVFENFRWDAMAVLGLAAVLAGNVLVLRPAKR
ncbi:MAG: DMT family transporter [Pseudorhodoplanes sp.]|uniref:DMT family transporter n=1 Tax=Pseudorhodoplanes sp. TaxID=1934341 RepID=UPI003D13FC51